MLYGYQASNSEFGPTDQATQLVLEVRFKKLAQRLAMLGDASVGSERSVSNTNWGPILAFIGYIWLYMFCQDSWKYQTHQNVKFLILSIGSSEHALQSRQWSWMIRISTQNIVFLNFGSVHESFGHLSAAIAIGFQQGHDVNQFPSSNRGVHRYRMLAGSSWLCILA